jgi:predicted CXXCH cytochrome family protein
MVPTYAGKTYAGKFVHPFDTEGLAGNTEYNCVDCHNVHDTDNHDVIENKMYNDEYVCAGCHGSGAFVDAEALKDRTVAYGQRLLDTLLTTYNERNATTLTEEEFTAIITSRGAASDVGDNDLAFASSIYTIFNYYDGSPHGTTHGHGGSWAHNSKFARQLQYDAIESLEGDLTGLSRP